MKKIVFACLLVFSVIVLLYFQKKLPFLESWNSWGLPLSGKVIVIDPGHGGPDAGANREGVLEKDISLDVALKLRDYLLEQGAIVRMTRETDKDLAGKKTKSLHSRKVEDLKKRAKLINQEDTDLFISIHLNAIPSEKWRGGQTFYSSKSAENKKFAELIQQEMTKTLANTDREARPLDDIYLMKNVKKTGALVEIGFLSNKEERALLVDSDYQSKIAFSIYSATTLFLSNESSK